MQQIYISSSYSDLIEERQAVVDVLVSRRHQPRGMEQYHADPTPPLDLCVKDVQDCTYYFGIFAFRYGSCPKGSAKSITHFEYEAAIEKKIPTYIFMLRENAHWPVDRVDADRTKINALRAHLKSVHTVKEFGSKDELISAVKDVVDMDIPAGRPFDPMLPFLCDRQSQQNSLVDVVSGGNARRPAILLVHGDDEQEHDTFREKLTDRVLPEELKTGATKAAIKPYHLRWPARFSNSQEFGNAYLREAGDKILCNRNCKFEQFRDVLAGFPGPLAFYSFTRAPLATGSSASGTQAFVDFWKRCPDLLENSPQIFAILFIEYGRAEGWLDRLRNPNAAVQRAVGELHNPAGATPCWTLPALDDIGLAEAEDWARSDEVSRDWDSNCLIDGIRDYFRKQFGKKKYGQGRLPMKILAEQLATLLGSAGPSKKDL